MPDGTPWLHGNVQKTLQTGDHRFLFNEAGVLVYQATEGQDDDELERSQATELSFADVLALAAFVELHREQLGELKL